MTIQRTADTEGKKAEPVREGGPRGGAASPRLDTTAALRPITAGLLDDITPAEVVATVVGRGVEALGAEAGLVALVRGDAGEERLDIVGARGYAEEVLGSWRRFPLSASLPLSDAVRERTPLFSATRADLEARYPEMFERGPTHPVKASASLPLVARGQAFGGLHLSFPAEREAFTPADRAFLIELARQCSLALDRALLLQEREDARARQEFLARAGALLAESLDYQTTLDAITRLAVPDLCDWAAVDLLDEAGEENGGGGNAGNDARRVLNVAVAHKDAAEVAWVRDAQRRYPVDMTQTGQPIVQVITTGRTLFLPDIPEEVLLAAARDEEHLRLIRRLDLHSYLCVPLTARGRTLGAVIFATARASGRVFSPETVALVEELARRAAVAIDNARLYRSVETSEQRFRALADNIAQLAWMADASGSIFWYNRRWFDYTGTTPDEMKGRGWRKVHDPERVEAITRRFREHVEAGLPWEDTFPLRGADGQFRWFLSRAFPTKDGSGRVILWCGTNTDITDQREAEARQRRFAREMLYSLTEGKMRLAETGNDLPDPLSAADDAVALSPTTLRVLRKQVEAVAERFGFVKERKNDLLTAVGEAAMNAVKHARNGAGRLHSDAERGTIQVWITDRGPGIAADQIHRALERGWTTGGFGHGWWYILKAVDRVYLLTGPTGTTVVLKMDRDVTAPAWLHSF